MIPATFFAGGQQGSHAFSQGVTLGGVFFLRHLFVHFEECFDVKHLVGETSTSILRLEARGLMSNIEQVVGMTDACTCARNALVTQLSAVPIMRASPKLWNCAF
jgi:hypothetical protein